MNKRNLLTAMLFLIGFTLFAQQKQITGTVSDASGPLPGATVVNKASGNGVVTDFETRDLIIKSGAFMKIAMNDTEKILIIPPILTAIKKGYILCFINSY